ncbi:hypothetical protein D7X25_19965 [bacterium 1XD42-8]|jgi:hypothetical protein|nr:hypothetical protein [Lachnospiraceae bacterium]RKJ49034.1 hypothetical protein D7X25_19965 [bacterium 1XD42-8]
MKIGEVKKQYSFQMNALRSRRIELEKEKKMNEKRQDREANEGVILELTALEEEYNKMTKFMEEFHMYRNALQNGEAARQQGEAMAEYTEDVVKCMEIARRISRGAKVPPYDEKKLMEFNFEMYMTAKNAAMINSHKSRKEYKSLWEDEEEGSEEKTSPSEIVDEMECGIELPDGLG